MCPVDDCDSSYRRKDHLNRHLLQHQGKLFECSSMGCSHRFSIQSNMKRHVKEFHNDSSPIEVDALCSSSYRRKDLLNRHLQDQGELFECSVTGCCQKFSSQSNMKKHVKVFHDDSSPIEVDALKEYTCPEPGCGKVFKYASRLRKHEDSHGNCIFASLSYSLSIMS